MTKITLPPCAAKAPICGDDCGRYDTCGDYEPFGGFDAVAAAVRKAGYLPLIRGAKYSDDYIAAVISVGGGPLKIELVESEETGPTPTAALVAAAVKVNEGG